MGAKELDPSIRTGTGSYFQLFTKSGKEGAKVRHLVGKLAGATRQKLQVEKLQGIGETDLYDRGGPKTQRKCGQKMANNKRGERGYLCHRSDVCGESEHR